MTRPTDQACSTKTGDLACEQKPILRSRRAGVAYFRSYDLRHTCATLLLYEGRTHNEVAEHLGHANPGFTARTYAHGMRDAPPSAHPDQ